MRFIRCIFAGAVKWKYSITSSKKNKFKIFLKFVLQKLNKKVVPKLTYTVMSEIDNIMGNKPSFSRQASKNEKKLN